MNKLQNATFKRKIEQIVNNVAMCGCDYDQVFWRSTSRVEDGIEFFDIECRIENPDSGYTADWFWVDAFGIGPRGRLI